MKLLLRTAIISILVLALLAGACGSIRWARRGGTAAGFAANALMLTFGMGLIATPPQRGVQQVQEQEDRTGGDSGDPPSHG
jgi:hypothetical protein